MSEKKQRKKRGRYCEYLRDSTTQIPEKVLKRFEARTGVTWEQYVQASSSSTQDGLSADQVDHNIDDDTSQMEATESLPTQAAEEAAEEAAEAVHSIEDERDEADIDNNSDDDGDEEEDFDFDPNVSISDEYLKLGLDNCLYEDSDVTLGAALYDLASIYKKYKISKACLSAFISHVKLILPEQNIYPKSRYKFKKIVTELSPNVKNPTITYHCNNCLNNEVPSFDSKCDDCESKLIAANVQSDLTGMIKDLFEHQNLSALIDMHKEQTNYRRSMQKDIHVTDICDGTKYLSIPDKQEYDLFLIQNTDGFPVAGSSTAQVWPNFLVIANIPYQYRKKYILVPNLWYAHAKPNMHDFMNPFVSTMKKLKSSGVDWLHPVNKKLYNSKVSVILSVADAQARAPLQNLNLYSGFYGCSFCEIKGKNYDHLPNSKTIYFPYSDEPVTLRCKQNMLENAVELNDELTNPDKIKLRKDLKKETPKYIKGVKGFSCMAFLPNFDVASSFTPEYMHSCLLGVVKSHLLDVFDSKNKEHGYYIGKFEKVVSSRLRLIKAPSFITRQPRPLSDVKYWKASEFRNWLLFYSLPCLENLWENNKFFKHYALLVFSIHTLLKSKIKVSEIIEVKAALKKFCSKFGEYYGVDEETFNVHMLLHYTQSVTYFGPLFAHSAFQFENENGILKERIHGTGNIATELKNTVEILNSLRALSAACDSSLITGNRKERVFLGRQEDELRIPSEILNFVKGLQISENVQVTETPLIEYYIRARIKGTVYTTENYSRATRTCSYYFSYKDSHLSTLKAAKALYFCNINGDTKIFVGRRVILQEPRYSFSNVTVKHILNYEEVDDLVWGLLGYIQSPLINIDLTNDENNACKVMCIPPNNVELNL